MKDDLREYLKFYLGCEVHLIESGVFNPSQDTWFLARVTHGRMDEVGIRRDGSSDIHYHFTVYIKPILRRIDDMTEEEKKEYNHRKQRKGYMPEVHADNIAWLISKRFDVFRLIHSGLAIDATKLEKHEA